MRHSIVLTGIGVQPLLLSVLVVMTLLGVSAGAKLFPHVAPAAAVDTARPVTLPARSARDPGVRTGSKFEMRFYESEVLLP
jgi:hypothetical protein